MTFYCIKICIEWFHLEFFVMEFQVDLENTLNDLSQTLSRLLMPYKFPFVVLFIWGFNKLQIKFLQFLLTPFIYWLHNRKTALSKCNMFLTYHNNSEGRFFYVRCKHLFKIGNCTVVSMLMNIKSFPENQVKKGGNWQFQKKCKIRFRLRMIVKMDFIRWKQIQNVSKTETTFKNVPMSNSLNVYIFTV